MTEHASVGAPLSVVPVSPLDLAEERQPWLDGFEELRDELSHSKQGSTHETLSPPRMSVTVVKGSL